MNEKQAEIELDRVRKKYGFEGHEFGVYIYSTGEVGIISKLAASMPFCGASTEKLLEMMFIDMAHSIQLFLNKMNPDDPWYKPNRKDNDE